MSTGFLKKNRDEMIQLTRPLPATYINSAGQEKVADQNVARYNYDLNGRFQGIKFGDGDTAKIPAIVNTFWRDESKGATIVAIGQAPQGVTWLKCGTYEIQGIDAHKIYIAEFTPAQVQDLEDFVTLFPNEDNVAGPCHFMTFKYYTETGIDFGEELTIMNELNTFLHEAWN